VFSTIDDLPQCRPEGQSRSDGAGESFFLRILIFLFKWALKQRPQSNFLTIA
jgi:hypothetical protein